MTKSAKWRRALRLYWEQAAAYTYLIICIMDFVIMPVYYEYNNAKIKNEELVKYAIQFTDGAAQIAALQTMKAQRSWSPITLDSSGWVHVSFGAILGVTAFGSNRRRKETEAEDEGEE